MFWGTRATNFSIYTTKMEGAGPKILGTGAKFKQVPCQKNCRVNRAIIIEKRFALKRFDKGPITTVGIGSFRNDNGNGMKCVT